MRLYLTTQKHNCLNRFKNNKLPMNDSQLTFYWGSGFG